MYRSSPGRQTAESKAELGCNKVEFDLVVGAYSSAIILAVFLFLHIHQERDGEVGKGLGTPK